VRALVAGWFSWELYGATAGDLMACEVACDWLKQAGLPHDVALAPPFQGGVDWRSVDPEKYTHVVFVCGPMGDHQGVREFLGRFSHCHRTGLDLSMLQPLDAWNPFDLLLERDSSAAARPDISLLCRQPLVPVVGVCLVHRQKEYGDRGRHQEVKGALDSLLAAREVATVWIDTRLDENSTGLRTPREVESLLARMDVVVTTRLHGTVLSLKNSVPPLVIDPIAGGAKVCRQARTLGWPVVFTADALDEWALREAFDYCLTPEARVQARECAARAVGVVEAVRDKFLAAFRGG
jgi:hypothetical protein